MAGKGFPDPPLLVILAYAVLCPILWVRYDLIPALTRARQKR